MSRWVTAVGLLLTLVGALILVRFSATPAETTKGGVYSSPERERQVERQIAAQRGWSRWGFALIALGTTAQIVALWIPNGP